MLAAGISEEQVLDDDPQLALEDIREALRFASANLDDRSSPFRA